MRLPLSTPSSSAAYDFVPVPPSPALFPKRGEASSGSLYKAFGVLLTLVLVLLPFSWGPSGVLIEGVASPEGDLDGSSDIV